MTAVGTGISNGVPGVGVGVTAVAGGEGSDRPPWYRRRNWVAAGLALAIVVASVVTDLPRRDTPALRRQDLSGFLSGIEDQVAQCNAGLHDALAAYHDALEPRPTVPVSTAAAFVEDGIAACSFSNAGVVALASQQAPRTLLTLGVGSLPSQVGLWAAYDA
ncbi:MAG: hypothetical protein ACYDEN_00805, partial [Acidimicrobiales bacterium]